MTTQATYKREFHLSPLPGAIRVILTIHQGYQYEPVPDRPLVFFQRTMIVKPPNYWERTALFLDWEAKVRRAKIKLLALADLWESHAS